MFPIYTPETARETLLKRSPPDELPLPPGLLERIEETFGERLTPAQVVSRILADVRREGDAALASYAKRLDGFQGSSFRVPAEMLSAALESLPAAERQALEAAAERIAEFHTRQPLTSWLSQEMGGTLGQLIRPIERVGLYVPGGTAPLPSSVLMSAVPARVAGVREIVVVAPPERASGEIHSSILAACAIAGVREVYTLGGAQAIAALAFGTETVRPVDKIFGPGNLFVTLAKQQVYGVVGIDGLAGPTETVVIADETARPAWVAADLLAQAEHDVLASAILLTPSRPLAEAVVRQIASQVEELSRAEIVAVSLANRGGAVITRDLEEAAKLSNLYAPEHLCLAVRDPWALSERISAAGGVFLGEHSFEVLGDYVAGPSHVMPTGGSARFASPLNVWDFVRIVSLIALNEQTAQDIGPQAARIARLEGLDAHARAAEIRLKGSG